jgi:hypothetical protein
MRGIGMPSADAASWKTQHQEIRALALHSLNAAKRHQQKLLATLLGKLQTRIAAEPFA